MQDEQKQLLKRLIAYEKNPKKIKALSPEELSLMLLVAFKQINELRQEER